MLTSLGWRVFIAAALLLLAAPLVTELYPFPWQRSELVQSMVEETFPASSPQKPPGTTAKDDTDELRRFATESLNRDLWKFWGIAVVGLLLSVVAAILTLVQWRWWAAAAVLTCLFFLAFTFVPLVEISISYGGVVGWVRTSVRAVFRDGVTPAALWFVYHTYVAPILYLILATLCGRSWWAESRLSSGLNLTERSTRTPNGAG